MKYLSVIIVMFFFSSVVFAEADILAEKQQMAISAIQLAKLSCENSEGKAYDSELVLARIEAAKVVSISRDKFIFELYPDYADLEQTTVLFYNNSVVVNYSLFSFQYIGDGLFGWAEKFNLTCQ